MGWLEQRDRDLLDRVEQRLNRGLEMIAEIKNIDNNSASS
jgi:hypothetical protein